MDLPTEMQNIIISFLHAQPGFLTVCKEWKKQIKNIQTKSANIIGSWYKKRLSGFGRQSVKEKIRYAIFQRPEKWIPHYPEEIVFGLDLTRELLTLLPRIKYRKKRDIRDWLINLPIDIDQWRYIEIEIFLM
jgi:hypothetical protein